MAVITKLQTPTDVTVCSWHPYVETGLRCNKCGRPICARCAKLTAVGYKCPDCVRTIQARFFNGTGWDYLIASVIPLPLSLVAGSLFAFLGSGLVFSWIISILAAPTVASFIAEEDPDLRFVGESEGDITGRYENRICGISRLP